MNGAPEFRGGASRDASGESALCRLADLADEFDAEHIAAAVRSVAERISEGRFYVACVGQFKRGKSTLLNALIGQSVLPVGIVPVTTVPTIIRYGERQTARIRLQSMQWTPIPVSSVKQYVSGDRNPENAKGVAGVEIFVSSPLLARGMCLVDTPGLGSVFAGNAATTRAFIPHIDAAIVVIGADPPLSGDELELVETVAQEVHELLFVLNKADRASDAERSAAVGFARRVLEERLRRTVPTIFEVSALERLERRGPDRDWAELMQGLESLMDDSGRLLVREATDRALRRAADQLLAMIKEERHALQRPVKESERHIAELRKMLERAEPAMRDLGVLFMAEQQRLSAIFADRRKAFLKQAPANAHNELGERLASVARRRSGPAYRRDVMHLVQEIASAQLAPWLEGEAEYAEEAFGKTARRFIELGNDFLRCLAETGMPDLEQLPPELGPEQGLQARSHFRFHVVERVAAPASPFLFIADVVLGALGLRGRILGDARTFLDQLLEVNSARVQSDIDERVRESRTKLEAEIEALLREATAIAERALARARTIQAAGAPTVEAALVRLDGIEREVLSLRPSH